MFQRSDRSKPSGPAGLEVADWMYDMNRNTVRAFVQLSERYGDVVRMPSSPDRPLSLLSMLMFAEDEETGERMSDEHVRDEVMTFIVAGRETTSNALSWSLYLRSLYPEVRRRLGEEVDGALGGETPGFESVSQLDYLEQVVDETLRRYPPTWAIEREPVGGDDIGDSRIPPESIVVAAPYFVHHNSDIWNNLEGFDPGRFADDAEPPNHGYAHFPFGGRPRSCAGADFAVLEAKIILAVVAQRFRLDLVPGQIVEPEGAVALYPKDGIEMFVRSRESAQ